MLKSAFTEPRVRRATLGAFGVLSTVDNFVGVGNSPEHFAQELSNEALKWQAIMTKAGTRFDD
jgi:hypothetical protein